MPVSDVVLVVSSGGAGVAHWPHNKYRFTNKINRKGSIRILSTSWPPIQKWSNSPPGPPPTRPLDFQLLLIYVFHEALSVFKLLCRLQNDYELSCSFKNRVASYLRNIMFHVYYLNSFHIIFFVVNILKKLFSIISIRTTLCISYYTRFISLRYL
jgi:hypothetical protein